MAREGAKVSYCCFQKNESRKERENHLRVSGFKEGCTENFKVLNKIVEHVE